MIIIRDVVSDDIVMIVLSTYIEIYWYRQGLLVYIFWMIDKLEVLTVTDYGFVSYLVNLFEDFRS